MPAPRALASLRPGSQIAGRYIVDHVLGRGGMGSVYAVRDTSSNRVVALKYLQREAARENGTAAVLFQREFHTLAHLRHPRVIQVYDYGIDAGRPYYTMELLDGSDLRELAPVAWRRGCQILREVASSLALLHSRRLLHRDLSPRNVRCTRDGQAKLIDFGAMTTMGGARDVAGTPPYMAPEAVNGQTLDARTDLYALGALAYWTLTGHDAYAARDARELRALWARPVVPPSALMRDVPEALDSLVMSLLSLDPQARPAHVTEVLERLTAVAGLEPIEHLDVARSYLATPTLVGHAETLAGFHKRVIRASRGRGSAAFVEGTSGLGRTRLLQTFMLEAKLCGLTVLWSDAREAGRSDLGVMAELLEGIAAAAPDVALVSFVPRAALLGHVLPGLLARLSEPPELVDFGDRSDRIAALDQAARDFVLGVASTRPLMLAVDDADHADEASVMCLALLARDAPQHKLIVSVSSEHSGRPRALAVLAEGAARHVLSPLDTEQTTRLLRSVFGETPNLHAASEWVHSLSQGMPRTIMELAQFLVDRRIAQYERGSWMLPDSIRDHGVPASLEQTFDAMVAALSSPARALAEALALVTDHGPLDLDEVAGLGGMQTPEATYEALAELEAARVCARAERAHVLARRGLSEALSKGLSEERRRSIHLRLARLYERRGRAAGDHARLLSAYHWRLAGELSACVEALLWIAPAEPSSFVRTKEGTAMYVAALEHALSSSAPKATVLGLRRVLMQLASISNPGLVRYAREAFDDLVIDSGRADWDRTEPTLEPARRIRDALRMAGARYEATAAADRCLDPIGALHELGFAASVLTSAYVVRAEVDGLKHVMRVLEPFCALSTGFQLFWELIGQAVDALRGQDVLAWRRGTLERLRQPIEGFAEAPRHKALAAVTYWVGIDEAVIGCPLALERAAWLESHPGLAALGARIRTVFHLFQGNEQEAEIQRKQREILLLGDPWGVTLTDARGVMYEAWGYFLCGSVLGMRRALAAVSEHAARFPSWQHDLHLVRGLYELLRGEPGRAVADLARCSARGPLVQALLASGDVEQSVREGETALAEAGEASQQPARRFTLRAAHALAVAEQGDLALAASRSDAALAEAEGAGVQGMLLCVLHEARARVAIAADDRAVFRAHVRKLGATYSRGTFGLRARYERLGVVARRALISLPPPPESSLSAHPEVLTEIGRAGSREQRLEHALRALAHDARATQGYLFALTNSGLSLASSLVPGPPPEGLEDMLSFYLDAELDGTSAVPHTVTGTFSASADLIAWINDGQHLYYPLLLSCVRGDRRVIAGVVVLALRAQHEPAVSKDLVSEISRCLLEAGDVVGAHAAT